MSYRWLIILFLFYSCSCVTSQGSFKSIITKANAECYGGYRAGRKLVVTDDSFPNFVSDSDQCPDSHDVVFLNSYGKHFSSVSAKCEAASTCRECILADPSCSWCAQLNKTGFRCRIQSVNKAECPDSLQYPVNEVTPTKNEPFSENVNVANADVVQLKPQALNVKLRPGVAEKFNLTFRRVIDYPLDLYYVMDLSFSMNDDLMKLKELGKSLVDEIKKLTNNVRLGFGTFVDKVMLPFASTIPEQLKDPCFNDPKETCAPVFGFRHQLPLTSNGQDFINAVQGTNISGNIDSPEGGFDALMQIAVCKAIMWRDVSLRVVLYASDASPHIAMDGKLAAILDTNDMKCHLERGVHKYYPNELIYADSKIQDYPSVGQLKRAFQIEKIQPVFAVTADVFPLYDKLRELLNPAYADVLASDSQNVISLISTSYNKIKSRVQLNVPVLPSNVALKYRVMCPGSTVWKENNLECTSVSLNDMVTFQFELTATNCLSNAKPDQVLINSNTIQESVALSLNYICECDCKAQQISSSPHCDSKGTLECGICSCNPGRSGSRCQCSQTTNQTPLEQSCTSSQYRKGVTLCNSQGFCECGSCICNPGFSGKFCECSNAGCPEDTNGDSCGGPTRGTCLNCNNVPKCICKPKWSVDSTGVCKCSDSKCKPDSLPVCNNHGKCNCDRCSCDSQFTGLYCQTCIHPQCSSVKGTCEEPVLKACASCLYKEDYANQPFGIICKPVCEEQNIWYENLVRSLPDFSNCVGNFNNISAVCSTIDPTIFKPIQCKANPISTCIARYIITWNKDRRQYQLYVKKHEEKDCPSVNYLLIVLPVIGAILLIGIIALIIWKILQTIHDKHEYEKFLTETNDPKWAKGKSGLYVDPNSRIQNPMFQGGNEYQPVQT